MSDGWNEQRFARSIPVAREQVLMAAQLHAVLKERTDWDGHQAGVELTYYLALRDYELKLLLHRFLTEPENRMVWEKYLALEIYECMEALPQFLGNLRRSLSHPSSVSQLNPSRVAAAAKTYSLEVRRIRQDKDFWLAVTRVRNGVAAHHNAKGGIGLSDSVAWAYSAWQSENKGLTPFQSQFGEYALALGSAIQDLGNNLVNET